MKVENDGDEGSANAHWERSLLKNEIMTASDIVGDIQFSGATINLLKDSGWYEVDDTLKDNMEWGRNAGCTFVSGLCTGGTFREFCSTDGKPGCSFNH